MMLKKCLIIWVKKMVKNKNPFTEKCICDWSKDDEYGFIPYTNCPVHGKKTREFIKKGVSIK